MTCETRHADRGKTDNPKTVTIEHIARIAVRHPQMVELGRHYGCVVTTCEPFDPESKGGVEATVKIAKADLVPTHANLRAGYGSFAELEAACAASSEQVNGRRHRETHRPPIEMPAEERTRLHVLPADPYALALGAERLVGDDRTVRWGDVRYSVPPGHEGGTVWCRVHGDELEALFRRMRLSAPHTREGSSLGGMGSDEYRRPRTRGEGPGTAIDPLSAGGSVPRTRGWSVKYREWGYVSRQFPVTGERSVGGATRKLQDAGGLGDADAVVDQAAQCRPGSNGHLDDRGCQRGRWEPVDRHRQSRHRPPRHHTWNGHGRRTGPIGR
ncbi:hypothetical protein GCM10017673_35150 [Streptosporangium violaceochromogenes]|nr:hypothetical protein GCM10017673_35150 [Streptosporangium violaceochromogenes]